MQLIIKVILLFISFLVALFSFAQETSHKKQIFVAIKPIEYLVKKITKDKAHVYSIFDEYQNLHNVRFTTEMVKNISKGDLYFALGKKLIPNEHLMNIVKGYVDLSRKTNITSSGMDHPHYWLRLDNLIKLSKTIATNIIRIDPANQQVYKYNAKLLQAELIQLKNQFTKQLLQVTKPVFTVHPAFTEFLDEFRIKDISLEVEGKEPTPKDIKNFLAKMKTEKRNFVITQPQFDIRAIHKLKQEEIKIFIINPLSFDFIAELKKLASLIE